MTQIMPFRGLIFNPDKVEDLNAVIAPPYDVISKDLQNNLYHRHPNNIVRLIYGKSYKDDTEEDNRYVRAAYDFRRWRSEGVLIRDKEPSIYFYVQTYTLKNGLTKSRKGFIARSRLEEFGRGRIYPHEKTLSGPKEDRLKLINACRANFSCIFSLYSQPSLTINGILQDAVNGMPIIDVADDEGVISKIWRVSDKSVIAKIAEEIAKLPLLIADGHHRYETALNYRNMIREKRDSWTGREPENYVMMYFSNMDDEGMTILPTHRVIHSLEDFSPEAFLNRISPLFYMEKIDFNDSEEEVARKEFFRRLKLTEGLSYSFGLYLKGMNSFFILKLKDRGIIDRELSDSVPPAIRELDLTLLHMLILNKILKIDIRAQEEQRNIIYRKDADAAINAVNEGCQAAFLLHPPRIDNIKRVSEANLVMPQKSTYFYPKLISGLIINPLE